MTEPDPSISQHDSSLPQTPHPPNPSSPNFLRLSQPLVLRLPAYLGLTSLFGLLLGARKGGEDAGLRFRAENAHRLPRTQTGWYLYHKSKNYHVALGGIKEGFRMVGRLLPWAGLFVLLEEGIDRGRGAVVREVRYRRYGISDSMQFPDGDGEGRLEVARAGNKDFFSTMLAGLTSAGVFARWKRMPLPTAVRLMKMGAKVGLGYGLLQDAVNLMQGRRLGYVEFIKRHTFWSTGTSGSRARAEVPAP